jgi:hypothetical protein
MTADIDTTSLVIDNRPPLTPDANEGLIEQRLQILRNNAEAQRRFSKEQRQTAEYPPIRDLNALLAQPIPPTKYRIDQLAPIDARVLVAAQHKAGKSTLTGNLIRSLVDGDPFLGRFSVNTPAERLVLVDNELSERTVRDWLDGQGIRNTVAVVDVITLRGNVAAFDLLDDECRTYWSNRLRDLSCDYLILDCLRPVLDALGLDEHRDAGRFLVNFDAMLTGGGVKDATLIHHMGHAGERARGDSRLLDWPDVNWRIIRENPEDPDSARFFHAHGRDVAVPEGELRINGRHLSYVPGSRGGRAAEAAARAVIAMLAAADAPMSMNGLETSALVIDHTRKAIRAGVKLALTAGMVAADKGPRGAKLHSIVNPCEGCGLPVTSGRSRHESCPGGVDELSLC